ncbi:MAG: FliM/FliN family flagellar motor C-terminal domain-containing protein [Terracidiphilus sp.]
MATTHPLPGQAIDQIRGSHAAGPAAALGEDALVPSPRKFEPAVITFNASVARLPIELDVAIPIKSFRVRNLLALTRGQVVETQWADGADMPLAASQVQLAWSEFEVIDKKLAVRLTRLA